MKRASSILLALLLLLCTCAACQREEGKKFDKLAGQGFSYAETSSGEASQLDLELGGEPVFQPRHAP